MQELIIVRRTARTKGNLGVSDWDHELRLLSFVPEVWRVLRRAAEKGRKRTQKGVMTPLGPADLSFRPFSLLAAWWNGGHSPCYRAVHVNSMGSRSAHGLFGVPRLWGLHPPEGGTPNGLRDGGWGISC